MLPDTAAGRRLAETLLQSARGREFASAELRLRQLYGKSFTKDLAPGTVTPVTALGQLVVRGMVLSRRFDGEITRTPGGYRITTAVPLVLSIRELQLEDELAAWAAAAGGGEVADAVTATVDLRLARRDTVTDRDSEGEGG